MKTAEQWADEIVVWGGNTGPRANAIIVIRAAMREAATEAAREAIVDALKNAEVEVDYWILPQAVQAIVARVLGEAEAESTE
jgi:hypothetical protein